MAVSADVADRPAVEAGVKSVEEQLGPIDLLVNAAGHVLPVGRTWEVDPDQWWRTMETNVKGTMNTCSAVARRMCPRKRGRIINVASSTVLHGRPYMSAYMTSKTAVVKMTEILATELDDFGVKAFSIHPGTVDTDMAKTLRRPENAHWLRWFEEIFNNHLDNPPDLGSHLVQYLATGKADDMSGRFFLVPLNMEDTISAFRQLASNSTERENANLLRIGLLADTRPRHPLQEGI
jgi:NAD(P)-dependent dehydrogenase (short-subunit alcohol dehydrogenase family)